MDDKNDRTENYCGTKRDCKNSGNDEKEENILLKSEEEINKEEAA